MPMYDEKMVDWIHKEWASAVAFIVLSCIFPSLLIITRKLNNANVPKWGWDEILVLPAMLVVIALCSLNIVDAEANAKVFDNTQPYNTVATAWVRQQKAAYTFGILYPIGTALPKLSLCALYLRIFSAQAKCSRRSAVLRVTAWITIVFLVANALAFVVPSAAVCSPPKLLWTVPPLPEELLGKKCLDRVTLGTWINLPHLVSDIVILVMPLPMVWGLSATASKRVELTLVFLTGGLGIFGAGTRFVLYIHQNYFAYSAATSLTKHKFLIVQNMMSVVEPVMYLIAACLPAILGFASRQSYDWLFKTLVSLKQSLRSGRERQHGETEGGSDVSSTGGGSSLGSDDSECVSVQSGRKWGEEDWSKSGSCVYEVYVGKK
ncbi:MAG: hypothetical protein M1831_000851 [Alyxoria varia]|nr:MAG: hypothetical protein M1831_000851 [Alyxoria varia]